MANIDTQEEGAAVYTVAEFCSVYKMSLTTWHKLRRENRAPRMMQYGVQARISLEAAREWVKMMEEHSNSAAERLEYQRRVASASKAGKIASTSPLHPCRQKPKPPAGGGAKRRGKK
jgi:hypothetical protein